MLFGYQLLEFATQWPYDAVNFGFAAQREGSCGVLPWLAVERSTVDGGGRAARTTTRSKDDLLEVESWRPTSVQAAIVDVPSARGQRRTIVGP